MDPRAGKPKLLSLFANWYSGATLFTILLDRHTEIVSNGESMFFFEEDERRYDCTCGRYIDECEFYRATAAHMRRADGAGWDRRLFVQVPHFSRQPLLGSLLNSWRLEGALRNRLMSVVPSWRRTRDRFLDAQLAFFENARRFAGASLYLDGTKSIRRAQLLARDARSEMKVLHLIRDGRGFCASYTRNENSRPSPAEAAVRWLRYIEQVDGFSRAYPSVPVLTIRYEDLCRSTEETLRGICRFLEIPHEDLTAGTTKQAHILGHDMRKTFDGKIVENARWKETLDPRTQAELTARMQDALGRFGYL